MKKSIFILPLAALLLSGCNNGGGEATSASSSAASGTSYPSRPSQPSTPRPSTPSRDAPPPAPEFIPETETTPRYRPVYTAPEVGKTYILGVWDTNLNEENTDWYDTMFYFNGHHHEDRGTPYPYYLSMTDDVAKATSVTIEAGKDENHFRIKINNDGEHQTYAGKYLACYSDNKSGIEAVDLGSTAHDYNFDFYFTEKLVSPIDGTEVEVNSYVIDSGTQTYLHGARDWHKTLCAAYPSIWTDCCVSHFWEVDAT